jgi:hypothetical protein
MGQRWPSNELTLASEKTAHVSVTSAEELEVEFLVSSVRI